MPHTRGSFVEAPPCEKEKGEQLFKDKCASCHTLGADEGHGSGPNLHGLFGRISGTAEGYQFSPPIRIKRLIWDEEALYRFLFDPQKFIHPSLRIPCTKVPDSKQRADLVCYLREAAGEYKLDRRPL